MKLIRHAEYPAVDPAAGVNRLQFPGLNTRIVVCPKGCVIPRHGHEQSEEIYVLSGRIRLNEDVLEPGDLLRTEAGESHEAEALEESRIIVMNTLPPQ